MTITEVDLPAEVHDIPAEVHDVPADAPLGGHDHIVGPGERGPDLARYALPWSVHVGVHLRPETPIIARLFEPEHRMVVSFGGYHADVTVYLREAQLDRLIAVLSAVRRRLAEHQS